jgi:predicted DNA-binding transcriptional regulator AlpA
VLSTPVQHDPSDAADVDDGPSTAVVVNLTPLLLNVRQVCAMVGDISERKIRAMVSAGQFPKPKKFGRVARWRRSDIEAWAAAL